MAQLTLEQAFQLAVQHHQAGRLSQAEQLYRQIIAREANHAQALHYLGLIAAQMGRNDGAEEWISRAIAANPDYAQAHSNLGIALRANGRLEPAIAAFRRAIVLDPRFSEAYCNLGSAMKEKGELDEAIAAYRRAISLNPKDPQAHSNLGNALTDKGQLDEAIVACRESIRLDPKLPDAHVNLGAAVQAKGQIDEAIAAYRQAIALDRSHPPAHFNLGTALQAKGELEEAIAAYRRAVALKPNYVRAQFNLGTALKLNKQTDEAIASYRQAIAVKPDFAEAFNNLGDTLKSTGALDESIAAYRRAIELKPDFHDAHSNLILALQYHPGYDAEAVAEEQRRWNRRHAEPLTKFIAVHANDHDPGRRLRIGYVSPDFYEHVVGRNLLPLFHNHDRGQFGITCYANVSGPDETTREFQRKSDRWRHIAGLSDERVAEQIRDDQIDILVDLALHTAHNRLLVFARKPAPVQATFAGYPGSTGLTTIDYRLSDPYLDPPGMDESIYSEKTIRLPDSFWCYDPLDCRDIPVASAPALATGIITFGCLNNFCKVNDGILSLWAQIMSNVPRSRLLLLAGQGRHRQRTVDYLAGQGVDPGRVEFIEPQLRRQYMELYHRIDLGLDSFPYNGHTTSLDSLWMGVPVVTLVGQTAVSRAGWCQLSNLGLTELAGQTPEQFVRIASELARDIPRLGNLRLALRSGMEQSPLMNAPRFARNIETAYRQMWRMWCASNNRSK